MTPATVQRLRPIEVVPDQMSLWPIEDEPSTITPEDTDSTDRTTDPERIDR